MASFDTIPDSMLESIKNDELRINHWSEPTAMDLRKDIHYRTGGQDMDLDQQTVRKILKQHDITTEPTEDDLEFLKRRRKANQHFRKWRDDRTQFDAIIAGNPPADSGLTFDPWEAEFLEFYRKKIANNEMTSDQVFERIEPYFDWCALYLSEVWREQTF